MEELAELEAFNAEGEEAATAAPETASDKVTVDVPEKTKEAQAKAAKKKKTPIEQATALVPKVSDVPVPTGGVGLLLFIALLIAFAIMPAPGQGMTRLVLIWKALIGQATLPGGASGSGGNVPSIGEQWQPSTPGWTNPTPGIGNVYSGTWGNQWGGGVY